MRIGSWRRVGALIAGAALLPVLAASPVSAAGIVVNSKTMLTQDDGTCTLPEAIKAANTDTASGVELGRVHRRLRRRRDHVQRHRDDLHDAAPDITQGVTINGDHKVTLNGQGGSSFFIAHASPIHLVDMVFTNGRASYGGAIFVGTLARRLPRRTRR